MPVYRAKNNYDRNNIYYPRGSQVSLTKEEAQADVENGTLELIGPDPTPPPPAETPSKGKSGTGGETAK
jgi:hypothetical protein